MTEFLNPGLNEMKVIPSILTSSEKELSEMIGRCYGVVERVSVDIIDGKFKDNRTIDPVSLSGIESYPKIDYHLMVDEPVGWIEKCIKGKADRIIGHIEEMSDKDTFIGQVAGFGKGAGLAWDLETPVEDINLEIFEKIDLALVMCVPSGFGGQKFQKKAFDKIKKLSYIRKRVGGGFLIHADGGITCDNIKKVSDAGADEVSVGRRLFDGDLKRNINTFYKSL